MVSVSLHTRTLQSKFAGNWERKILLRHSSNREMSVWLRRKKNFHIEILFTWDRTLTCGTRDKYVIITSSKLHIYLFLPLFLDVSLPPTIPSVFTTQPLMFSDPTPTSDPYPLVPNSSKNIFNVVCEEKDDDFKKQKHKTWLTYKFLWHLRVLPPTPPSHKPGRSPTCIIYFILDWEEELDNATLLLLSLLPNHTSAPTVPPPQKNPMPPLWANVMFFLLYIGCYLSDWHQISPIVSLRLFQTSAAATAAVGCRCDCARLCRSLGVAFVF